MLATIVACLLVFFRPVGVMERANLPIEALEAGATVVFVGECTRVEAKPTQNGAFEDTTYFHHMRIDRLIRDGSGTLKAGDTVAVISGTRAWTGTGQPPTYGSGHRGLPAKGESKRVYCRISDSSQKRAIPWLAALEPNGWQPVARRVTFIGADDEYRSEITLPLIADCLLKEATRTIEPTHAFAADPKTGKLDLDRRDHIAGLESLQHAELAVLFMRWRELPAEELRHFQSFFSTGRPVVGLRTSTHMLRITDPALADFDDELATRLFGQKWISHAGADTRTRVLAPEGDAAKHPILRGVKGGFTTRSWLYDVEPLPGDCTVLLWGEVVREGFGAQAGAEARRQPIVWVREATKDTIKPFGSRGTAPRRMAFTTLGHPEDFSHAEVRRLVEQMIVWASGDEGVIPAEGLKAEPGRAYEPPATR
jgi:hypothetical protein